NDDASAPGPNALHSHTSKSQSNPKPHATPNAASASRFRSTLGIQPAITPTRPHPSICHGVQGPWPRNALDASAAAAPVASPARGPRVIPVTATIIVTGWTFGIAANTTRPAAAAAARAATRASSRLRLGPVSIAAMTSATATTAARVTTSSMDGLAGRCLVPRDPAPVHRDRGRGDVCDEPDVV